MPQPIYTCVYPIIEELTYKALLATIQLSFFKVHSNAKTGCKILALKDVISFSYQNGLAKQHTQFDKNHLSIRILVEKLWDKNKRYFFFFQLI